MIMTAEHRTSFDPLEPRVRLSPPDRNLITGAARREAIAEAVIAMGRAFSALINRALGSRAFARHRDERVRRELLALTDRDLADIGLTRGDRYRADLSELSRGGIVGPTEADATVSKPTAAATVAANDTRRDAAA
jgi:uncharacterized protein YjiS (DUF1127 family)